MSLLCLINVQIAKNHEIFEFRGLVDCALILNFVDILETPAYIFWSPKEVVAWSSPAGMLSPGGTGLEVHLFTWALCKDF